MHALELHAVKGGFELRGEPLVKPMVFHGEDSHPAIQMVRFLCQIESGELRIFDADGELIETRRFEPLRSAPGAI